jgi:guanylate kinase
VESDPYHRRQEPLLIVISGPSGVGKDTVVQCLKERQVPFYFVVTATNRKPRPDEEDGVDYIFVTTAEFAQMIEDEELLEYAFVYDDYKGVPKEQVRQAFISGQDVIMRVDVQGAATIRQLAPEALLIFLIADSDEEMLRRLRDRKTDSEDAIAMRVATSRQELKRIDEFDYCVVNPHGDVDSAVDRILAIIEAEHARVRQRRVRL